MKALFPKIDFAIAPSSIRFRAALFATIGVLLLFLVFAMLEAGRVGLDLQQVTGTQQMTLVTRIAEELDDKIRITHRALIETAAATPPQLMDQPEALERSLQNQPGFRSLFDDVYVIGRDGRVLIELPKLGRRGIDVRDRNYFRRTVETRAPVISEPYMGRGLKEPTVMMTAPILDRNGEVVGMLTGALHPLKPNLLGKLAEARVGKTGSFALFTRDRVIVVSRDKSRIMTPGPAPGVSPSFDHAVAGQAGWEESTNSRGLHALFSYTPLTTVPWILSAALPIDEANAPIAHAQHHVAGMAALLALLVAPLVWFGTGALLSPISELRDTIQRIRLDPSATTLVQTARRDEIGDLAVDFNRMIEDLRERTRTLNELNATLELRVTERTADLENALDTLSRAQDELVRAEKLVALGALVAGVAHELNTPIGNAITIASTLRDRSAEFEREIQSGALRRSVLDDYTRTILQGSELVMRNLDQAADLVTNFKQVAVDQTSAQRRCFDLKEVIEEVLSTLHHLVRKKPIRVVTDLAAGVKMDSYPGPLGQVITNLFNNALIHGFAGRAGGEISIRTRREGDDRVVLEIRDDGGGIAGENLRKVFDPFFTTRLGQGGSGLGLNIVHNIVTQLMGGRITVESTPERGTGFSIELPLVAPPADGVPRAGTAAVTQHKYGS